MLFFSRKLDYVKEGLEALYHTELLTRKLLAILRQFYDSAASVGVNWGHAHVQLHKYTREIKIRI
jgi:hypothetical protein